MEMLKNKEGIVSQVVSGTMMDFHFAPPISMDPGLDDMHPLPKTPELTIALQNMGFFSEQRIIPLITDYLKQDPSVKEHGVHIEDKVEWNIYPC